MGELPGLPSSGLGMLWPAGKRGSAQRTSTKVGLRPSPTPDPLMCTLFCGSFSLPS